MKNILDTANFAKYFVASPAAFSTPHLYISALVTWSKESFIFSTWIKHFPFLPSLTHFRGNTTTPLMSIQTNNMIFSVKFSNDGAKIVSGSYDNSVQVWDASTGGALKQLNGHTAQVNSVAFSDDGIHIVSGSDDKSVRVWDASTGAALQQLNGHTDWVNSVAFSLDGIHIVSGSSDKSVRVWDALTGAALQRLNGHTHYVNSGAFSYDSMHIISDSSAKSVQEWGTSTDVQLQQLNSHMVSGSDITSVWIWDEIHHGVLWTSTMDGWIVSLPNQDRLMWIPQGIREVIHHPYNILIISKNGYAHIDFQGCNVGTKWVECYKPLYV